MDFRLWVVNVGLVAFALRTCLSPGRLLQLPSRLPPQPAPSGLHQGIHAAVLARLARPSWNRWGGALLHALPVREVLVHHGSRCRTRRPVPRAGGHAVEG